MKFGVVIFPGSNCDHDCYYAIESVIGRPVSFIWHQDSSLSGFDAVILPGGFAYGDYLRTGALAKFSPVMAAIKDFAKKGGLVLGICNGFQILAEAGLLPRCFDAQFNYEIHLQISLPQDGDNKHAVHEFVEQWTTAPDSDRSR